ncbi:undecaprenyldiphospho-muramoylpentapeptide beta-N-acetylglucosaminyltransferase [bacterium]|nr:undecaprenyldiphospho-muramoylpentapeptide beta-N-acetylglucosaminyltransferase [bacterium]
MANEENINKQEAKGAAGSPLALSPGVARALAKAFGNSRSASAAMGKPVGADVSGESAKQPGGEAPVNKINYIASAGGSAALRRPILGQLNTGSKALLKNDFKVAFAGGGTGGHLYPALAVADELKRLGITSMFFDSGHGVGRDIVPRHGYDLRTIMAQGLGGGILDKIKACFKMACGFVQSIFILRQFAPRVVVASGGYVSVPAALAGAVLGIPIVIMEQNAFAGKAVKLLANFASCICVSMPGRYAGLPEKKLVFTGNPVRSAIVNADKGQAMKKLGIKPGQFCAVVMGGSQGAKALNEAVLKLIPQLTDREMTLIHLTGESNFAEVSSRSIELVKDGRLDYRAMAYCDDMASLYAAANLVVCRAGATTLAEITAKGLPSILVPYPHAAENHQEANARILESKGAAIVILDKDVEKELPAALLPLLSDEMRLRRMGAASRTLGCPEAAKSVAKQILAAGK